MSYVLPRFFTKKIAEEALGLALEDILIEEFLRVLKSQDSKEPTFHVVIMGHQKVMELKRWPNNIIVPEIFAEYTYGDPDTWPENYDYAKLARRKAYQYPTGNLGSGIEPNPVYMFPDDVVLMGAVSINGLIVACSGVQPQYDRMISGHIAYTSVTHAYRHSFKSMKKGSPYI